MNKRITAKTEIHDGLDRHVGLFLITYFFRSYYKKLVRKPGKLQRNKHRSKDLCWKVRDPA